jgi:hypothetical protein
VEISKALRRQVDQQTAENFVRNKTPMRRQPHAVGVQLQQTGVANLQQRRHRFMQHSLAKLAAQTFEADALVQTQA